MRGGLGDFIFLLLVFIFFIFGMAETLYPTESAVILFRYTQLYLYKTNWLCSTSLF